MIAAHVSMDITSVAVIRYVAFLEAAHREARAPVCLARDMADALTPADLRSAIVEALYPISAYELAEACTAFGLAPQADQDDAALHRGETAWALTDRAVRSRQADRRVLRR